MQAILPSNGPGEEPTDIPPVLPPASKAVEETNETEPVSLFQSAADSDHSDSSSDSDDIDAEADIYNNKWADLMLQLDGLRIAGGGGAKGKGNRKKGSGVVLETPEMREIVGKIKVVEKEYMFNRKDAGQYRPLGSTGSHVVERCEG